MPAAALRAAIALATAAPLAAAPAAALCAPLAVAACVAAAALRLAAPLVVATLLALAAAASASPTAAAAAWRLPTRGEVVRSFTYDERRPFAAGSRRGVDLAARPNAAVWAACSGRVSHAGRVPRRGLGVSVRCGHLTATHLGLGALTVRRGDSIRRGQRLGRAGPAGVVRLGARVTARPFGWIDPLELVNAPPPPDTAPPIPVGPSPGPRAPARPVPARPRAPVPAARARPLAPRSALPAPGAQRLRRPPTLRSPAPRVSARPIPREVPALAWLGAALLAAGLPLGAVLTVRRSRSRQAPRPGPAAARLRG